MAVFFVWLPLRLNFRCLTPGKILSSFLSVKASFWCQKFCLQNFKLILLAFRASLLMKLWISSWTIWSVNAHSTVLAQYPAWSWELLWRWVGCRLAKASSNCWRFNITIYIVTSDGNLVSNMDQQTIINTILLIYITRVGWRSWTRHPQPYEPHYFNYFQSLEWNNSIINITLFFGYLKLRASM